MVAFKKSFARATLFFRKLRGGSQPVLIQADNGHLYVAKFANNPQGSNLLFNESMGAELYRACRLNVPGWEPLLFTDEFIDRFPQCWLETEYGSARPRPGLAFASRYLAADQARVLEILPGTAFQRIRNRKAFWLAWLVDVCAEHTDHRQALFAPAANGYLLPYFIDHGHLFGGAEGNCRMRFIASRYLDPRIYPRLSSEHPLSFQRALGSIDVDHLRGRLATLPEEWRTSSAVDAFERCLQRLANRTLLENLLDTIVESVARRTEIERSAPLHGLKPSAAVLRA
jgi:hypothetical protein